MSFRAALGLALALAGSALTQRGPALVVQLAVPGKSSEGALVSATRILDDPHVEELLRAGFAAEMHFRLELWRSGRVFDDIESSTTWDTRVKYDPYTQLYRVGRRQGLQMEDLGSFATLPEAEAVLAKPFRVSLAAAERGRRYYYVALLEVETLQVSDLDELQRWLRGDVQPAVRGRGNPLSALRNGLGRLLSRVLGGDKHSYDQRSPIFVAE